MNENYKIINAAILNSVMVKRIDSITEKCHPLLGDGRSSYENQDPEMMIIERVVKGIKKIYVVIDRDEHGNGTLAEGGTMMLPVRFRELQSELGDDFMFYSEMPQADSE